MLTVDESAREEVLQLTRDLVRINSVNPPGNEQEIADYVEQYLNDIGIDTESVPLENERRSVVGRIPGSNPGSIVLCGHLDTVRVVDANWSTSPFDAQVTDNKVYGRGSADMKSGVAAILQVAKLIVQSKLVPEKSIVLALTADEEKEYRGATAVAESGLLDDAEFLLITEPTGGNAYCGQKGEFWVKAMFSGKAGHGSQPESGVSAILPAAKFCIELSEAIRDFETYLGRGRTSLNIGQFEGGRQVNIVPDFAAIRLDSRVVSDDDKEKFLDLVDRIGNKEAGLAGAKFTREILSYKAPIISDIADQHVQRFLEVSTNKKHRQHDVEIAPYSTDAVSICPCLDIPVVIYGPGNIAQAHQPDEYVELESLQNVLDVLTRFLDVYVTETGNDEKEVNER